MSCSDGELIDPESLRAQGSHDETISGNLHLLQWLGQMLDYWGAGEGGRKLTRCRTGPLARLSAEGTQDGEPDHVDTAVGVSEMEVVPAPVSRSRSIVPPAAEEKDPGVTGVWRNLNASVRFGRPATVAVVVSGGREQLQRALPKPCLWQTLSSSTNTGVSAMTVQSA